jgi:flagellar biosynthesis GTPase FlhF
MTDKCVVLANHYQLQPTCIHKLFQSIHIFEFDASTILPEDATYQKAMLAYEIYASSGEVRYGSLQQNGYAAFVVPVPIHRTSCNNMYMLKYSITLYDEHSSVLISRKSHVFFNSKDNQNAVRRMRMTIQTEGKCDETDEETTGDEEEEEVGEEASEEEEEEEEASEEASEEEVSENAAEEEETAEETVEEEKTVKENPCENEEVIMQSMYIEAYNSFGGESSGFKKNSLFDESDKYTATSAVVVSENICSLPD